MSPEARAIVFDLDDTLYPYRAFLRSGFAAVSAYLERAHGVNRAWVLRWLIRASRGSERGRELQACLAVLRLSPALLPILLRTLRAHDPAIRLPRVTARALDALRADGWRLGILTNGAPAVQARKVCALGLPGRVDAVVFAAEHGTGAGKPEPAPFAEIARRLDVDPARVVVVGNDARADVGGAARAGMRAVACAAWTPGDRDLPAGTPSVARLADVAVVATLVLEEAGRHAA